MRQVKGNIHCAVRDSARVECDPTKMLMTSVKLLNNHDANSLDKKKLDLKYSTFRRKQFSSKHE